jgi:hypothetical protein
MTMLEWLLAFLVSWHQSRTGALRAGSRGTRRIDGEGLMGVQTAGDTANGSAIRDQFVPRRGGAKLLAGFTGRGWMQSPRIFDLIVRPPSRARGRVSQRLRVVFRPHRGVWSCSEPCQRRHWQGVARGHAQVGHTSAPRRISLAQPTPRPPVQAVSNERQRELTPLRPPPRGTSRPRWCSWERRLRDG